MQPPNQISHLHPLVERTGNHLFLLLFCQLMEIHCVSGHPDRKVRIFFRIMVCIHQKLTVQHIYIEVMRHLCSSREEMRELLTTKANVDRVLKMEVEQDVEKEKDHGQR